MNPLAAFFSGKKILITGHTGFKGSWISEILLGMGSEVAGYSLEPDTTPNLFTALGLGKRMKSHIGDIRDYGKLLGVFRKEMPEIVIHMAAQPLVRASYDEPRYTFDTNLMGTVNVLEAVREAGGVKAALMVTTDKVYENKETLRPYKEEDELGGFDPYSASKACAEMAIRSYRRSFFDQAQETFVASARAGNVLGGGDWSRDRIVPDMVRSIFGGSGKITLRNPGAVRPWQHVLDPLHGYLLLAKGLYEGKKVLPGAWNFAPDENSISVEDLVRRSIGKLGKGSYEVNPGQGKHEAGLLMLDASKARDKLGWKPKLGIEESLDWTLEWYESFYKGGDAGKITKAQIARYMELKRG
jgi:CDP-glucose 4,6-dehydratase